MDYNPEWTAEEAHLAYNEYGPAPGTPYFRWMRHRAAIELEDTYKNGNEAALMLGVQACLDAKIPLLPWIEKPFRKGVQQYLGYNLKSNSWDHVFGKPYPKGTHLSAKRKRLKMRSHVWRQTRLLVNAGITDDKGIVKKRPIDASIFEEVGAKLGLCKTVTEELYYELRKKVTFPGTNLIAKGKRLKMERNARWQMNLLVNAGITNDKDIVKKRPIDTSIFAEVGEKFGLDKTVTEELYYELRKRVISQENNSI